MEEAALGAVLTVVISFWGILLARKANKLASQQLALDQDVARGNVLLGQLQKDFYETELARGVRFELTGAPATRAWLTVINDGKRPVFELTVLDVTYSFEFKALEAPPRPFKRIAPGAKVTVGLKNVPEPILVKAQWRESEDGELKTREEIVYHSGEY